MAKQIARGVAALAVLAVLFLLVWNWYGDFKSVSRGGETTSTPEATATPSTDGQGSDLPPAQEAPPQVSTELVETLIDGVNFRPQPDSTSTAFRGLNKGDRLVLIAKEGDWYHVTDADGRAGYVTANPQYTRIMK